MPRPAASLPALAFMLAMALIAPPSTAQTPEDFDTWLAGFRDRAAAAGIGAATLDAALPSITFLPDVIERDRNQFEFTRTVGTTLTAPSPKTASSPVNVHLRNIGTFRPDRNPLRCGPAHRGRHLGSRVELWRGQGGCPHPFGPGDASPRRPPRRVL